MPTLNHSLNIGGSALRTKQGAIATVGHNIANVETEGYTRQQVSTQAIIPNKSELGAGVTIGNAKRIFDRFTQSKIIQESPKGSVFEARTDFLSKLEVVFNESEGNGLRSFLNDFWDGWSALANNPESEITRAALQNDSIALATKFRELHQELRTLRKEANASIAGTVAEINSMAKQIAELNDQIRMAEGGGVRKSNDLRDQRMVQIEKLSQLIDLNYLEDKYGRINIVVARGWNLVEKGKVNPLEATLQGGEIGMYRIKARGAHEYQQDITEIVQSGKLKEYVRIRDETLVDYMNQLDDLAFGLSHKINRHHSSGTGLNSATSNVTSSFGLHPNAVEEPLPFLKNGSFTIRLVDENLNFPETFTIAVEAGKDTLKDIVERINQTVGDANKFEATIQEDGSVYLESGMGNRFIFGDDNTDFALLMGFNHFFQTLKGAGDIRLSDRIMEDVNHISTGKNLLPGDNQVALEIVNLQSKPTMRNDTITFDEFYNSVVADVGLRSKRTAINKENQDHLLNEYKNIRNSVSAVNIDEEMAQMVEHQKAYQASARFMGTIDEMMETVIQM